MCQRGGREKMPRKEGVNQRRKHILLNMPKVRAGQASQWRERRPTKEAGQRGEVGSAGPDPKWKFKGKIDFEFQRLLKFWQDFENFYKEI
jgi:hypothetical protein